jgi:hypothetical protein
MVARLRLVRLTTTRHRRHRNGPFTLVVAALFGATACGSGPEPTPAANLQPASDVDRARLAQAISAQVANPGDPLFSAPASVVGVRTWTVYFGDLGLTAAGSGVSGETAAIIAMQIDGEGNLRDAECAVSADVKLDCATAARALAADLGDTSAQAVRPAALPVAGTADPEQICRAGVTELIRQLGTLTDAPVLNISCNHADLIEGKTPNVSLPEGSCFALATDGTLTAPLPGYANACCASQPKDRELRVTDSLVAPGVPLLCFNVSGNPTSGFSPGMR